MQVTTYIPSPPHHDRVLRQACEYRTSSNNRARASNAARPASPRDSTGNAVCGCSSQAGNTLSSRIARTGTCCWAGGPSTPGLNDPRTPSGTTTWADLPSGTRSGATTMHLNSHGANRVSDARQGCQRFTPATPQQSTCTSVRGRTAPPRVQLKRGPARQWEDTGRLRAAPLRVERRQMHSHRQQ